MTNDRPPERIFRYVLHEEMAMYKALGWVPVPALDSTYHGQWSVLMEYVGPDREHPMSPPND